ncbi:F-box domain containing protein [Tanacetum coccineum]
MDSSWRQIPQVPPYPIFGDGIFAHGCLYWLDPGYDYESKSKSRELICLDIRNEEFMGICPPKKRCGYSLTYQLVDLQGEVGFAYLYGHDIIIEVWVTGAMTETYGVKDLFVYSLKSRLFGEVNIAGQEYGFGTYIYMYPASSMFSIRDINKTAHSNKTDLKAGL